MRVKKGAVRNPDSYERKERTKFLLYLAPFLVQDP